MTGVLTMEHAPPLARLKHLLATTPAGRPLARLRALGHWPRRLRHPELATLWREGAHIDRLLPRFVGPGAACLDVGAHYGAVAWRLRALSRGGWLGLVEASPWKAALLRRRFAGASVYETAVSDTDGHIGFFENLDRPGFSSLSDRASRGRTRRVRVPVARLDGILADASRIDFVKIDVEGHEYPALRGAGARLRDDRPVILFEAGAVDDEDIDTSQHARLFDWLTGEMGYRVHGVCDLVENRPPLDAEGFRAHRVWPFTAFNFFALPAEAGGGTDTHRRDRR